MNRCDRCKQEKQQKDFVSPRTGRTIKTCATCVNQRYCKHNRMKITCKECGGSQICMHNIRRSQCKDCGGGSICMHNLIKGRCKECDDPFIVISNNMVNNAKKTDKKKGREFDIDTTFCLNLLKTITKCIYCECEFTYSGRKENTFVTLQRLNNDIGHIKSNCSLCCYECNVTDGLIYRDYS